MKLKEIAKKPTLVEIKLDDEEVIQEFGEPLEFFTWDRQPLDVFMQLASAKQDDPGSMINALRPLVLDENGQPILVGDVTLPSKILIKTIAILVSQMGK